MNIPIAHNEVKLDSKNRFFLPAKIYHALEITTDNLFVVLAKSSGVDGEQYIKLIDQAVLDIPRDPLTCDSLSIVKNLPHSQVKIDPQHRILLSKDALQRLFGIESKTHASESILCFSLGDHIAIAKKEIKDVLNEN